LLIFAKIHGLKSKSIDFVLAFPFPQANLEVPVYMELLAGINPTNISDGDQRHYVLKLNKSLYSVKQAGYNWFEKLREGPITCNFIQVRLINASSFERIALFSRTSTIALYLEKI